MSRKMMIVDDEHADLARVHGMTYRNGRGRFEGVAA